MKKLKVIVGIIATAYAFAGSADTQIPNLKVLSESSTGWVENFNPWIGGRTNWVYEPLVIFDPLNSENVYFWLAESYTMSEDMKSLVVKLREGVQWSDGEPFTADDVIFTYDYSKQHPEIDTSGIGERVTSADQLDQYTVRFNMREPNAFAAYDVLGDNFLIVPKHIWSNIEQPAKEINKKPVGTGPFTEITRFTPQVYIQCKNKYYWNDDLSINCLEFPQYSTNDAALEMLSKGQVDWAGVFIPDIERTYSSKNPNNKYWFPSADGVRLTFNFDTENESARRAFNNVEFRKAVNLAMDRDAMIYIGAYGYVVGGNSASNLPMGLTNWKDEKAEKVWSKFYDYDLKRAQKILNDAGFVDTTGNGYVNHKDGTEIKFRIQVPSGWSDWINVATIAVEGLRNIGIDVTIVTPEANAYAQNWADNNFEAQIAAGSVQPSIWKFYDYTMHSNYSHNNLWWSTGMHNYKSNELDSMIDELSQTLDTKHQSDLVAKIEMYNAENVLNVPLYYSGVWYEYNDSRFDGFASEENPFIFPAPFGGLYRLVHVTHIKPKQ
ncbi:ABC transporter substrate-binding protein [Vibrio maritimus]